MKRGKFMLLLLGFLVIYNPAKAEFGFENPGMAFGVSLGGALGDNSSADNWAIQYRGHFQYKLISPVVLGQLSAGYTKLSASGVYTAELLIMENRFLIIPFSLENLNPYLYSGIGVTKTNNLGPSKFLPMVPMGLGFQTRLGSNLLLEVSGGYNLSLSDDLDERSRSDTDLNSLTNKKHDAYFGFIGGISYTIGSNQKEDRDNDGLSTKIEKELGTDPKKADTDGDDLNDGAEVNKYKTDPRKTDTDGDGLNDGAEVTVHNTDPLKADTDGDGLNDAAEVNQYKTYPLKADTDGDGLNDGTEVNKYKTDPRKADTDGDGLSDGDEVKYKSNPLMMDSDGDSLNDGAEVNQHKTDPLKADTDGDGLSDGVEVNQYKTDPLKADTDGNGLSDGAEVTVHKTDPLKADTDGDGLIDAAEVNRHKTDPLKADTDGDGLSDGVEVNQYKTDPLKADTDGDSLSDSDEVKYNSNPLMMDSDGDRLNDGAEVNQHKTDPIKTDSDGDGLSDGDEVNKYMTNPLKIDTDDGGVHDGAEINSKTDPLNSKDDIVKTTKTIILEKGKRVVLRGVNFETNKATLTPDSKDILEIAYQALIANPEVNVEISGHTDDVGNDADNQKLSLERAQAVKNWLVQRGIPSNRMKTVGKGEKEPISDNSTEQGRSENRRIEFYVE